MDLDMHRSINAKINCPSWCALRVQIVLIEKLSFDLDMARAKASAKQRMW